MTSWICSRRVSSTASEPGVLFGDRPVLPLDSDAPGQRCDGASELLEPGAGKPDLEVSKRNGAIGSSSTHERFGECGDLHLGSLHEFYRKHCAHARSRMHR